MPTDDEHRVIEAFQEAFASLKMEGFDITQYAKEQAKRIVRGEITFDEAIENAKKRNQP